MGLAASQVRMLSLTTRKAYLQKDLLQNSHRKIALSREMSKLSDKYYDALSQERIMYLSDSGEYKNLSYSFLMGKVGGVEDIDVKDDTSLLLLNTKDGKVILSHDMANAIHFSKDALASDPNNIYLAIARLCSDTNITTPENSDLTFIISPELVKDICAGKYDTFDETDLTKAINNKKYQLYTVNVNDEMEPTNNFEDLGIYITDGFVNSINENTLYKVDIPAGMELTGNQTDDKYVVDAIVRNIAAE